jgi:ribosome-binding protein aMBF1 (putative translation factor)
MGWVRVGAAGPAGAGVNHAARGERGSAMTSRIEGFGERLRSVRKSRGLTRHQLADGIGRSQDSIARIDAGTALQPRMVTQIAAASDINPVSIRFDEPWARPGRPLVK